MKILVTGAAGFIGSVLCPELLAAGHMVTALDSLHYGQVTALAQCCHYPGFEFVRGDARNPALIRDLIKAADVILPLAALVGAPLCAAAKDEATAVNYHAVEFISATASKDQLIIYPNSNSGYGATGGEPCTEETPLKPISHYGHTKCAGEAAVLRHPRGVVLRLATVFGASSRMRTDLLVNDLTLRAVRDGSIVLFEGHHRRSYVHVRDVVAAFKLMLNWTPDARYKVFDVVGTNATKRELAEVIRTAVPGTTVIEAEIGRDPDQRDYAVSGARLRAAGWWRQYSLEAGIRELVKLYAGFPKSAMGNV